MANNNTRKDDGPAKWPWGAEFALALCGMVLVALFLIGLPYVVTIAVDGANGPESPGAAKAWSAIVPSLLGLTTMTISGIFLFMTLRIDRGARAEAREAAEKKVEEIIKSKIGAQLNDLLAEARGKNDVQVEEASQRIKVRADAFNRRMEDNFVAIDVRLGERFEDADERLRERIAVADVRINDRVEAADAKISDRVELAQNRIEQTASIAQERMDRAGRVSR